MTARPGTLEDAAATRIPVELGSRRYDIVVGDNLIASAGDYIAPLLGRPFTVIVSDCNVDDLYGDILAAALDDAGIAHDRIVLPAGEETKSFEHLEQLTGRLLSARVERGDVIIALGGGVVGDLAGFAASVLRRGVDIIQVPTTLLAQVDSAIGGKTGINTPHGKNLVGSFHQPRLVLADISTLDSLPARELRAGYAEIVKYGVIGDMAFFEWLEQHGREVLEGLRSSRLHAVTTSCRAKAESVAADEHEKGARALLNLGHTFGHALEAEAGYGDRLRHGEAVAVGIMLAMELSVRLGLCPEEDAERVRSHIAAIGLPTSPAAAGSVSAEGLVSQMAQDKKVRNGKIPFVLCRGIGSAFVATDVDLADVRAVLDARRHPPTAVDAKPTQEA